MKEYGFNAEMAKANVKEYELQVESERKQKAEMIVAQWLKTIEKDSQNGMTTVTLQSSCTDTINKYVKVELEMLGFRIDKKGQVFKISWL